ncbi:MAG: transcription elongation factor GreA [Acutalibacteraceae bacterium]|nr:transcription elongation factor GreA [Acutalibacteraceae bacterium]
MALEKIKLTHDALQELQDELDHLKSVGRREMSEKIKVALSFGDLSENSEYDEAKSEQGKMESRIQELEATIQNAEIIDESELSADTVNRSSKVTIHDLDMDEDETFVIVGFTQADPLNGKLSDESPIGKAILGKREGDVVEVELPNNKKTSVRIVKIEQKN